MSQNALGMGCVGSVFGFLVECCHRREAEEKIISEELEIVRRLAQGYGRRFRLIEVRQSRWLLVW